MDIKKDFKKLYDAYKKNIIKKSLIYSLLLSLTALFVTSLFFWIFNVKQFYIAFIGFAILEGILFSIFYYLNRPNETNFARELDALGLEQRVITMYEYKDDDSLMAKIQRTNAIEHMGKVDTKLLRFVLPTLFFSLLIAASILSVSASTVSILSATGVIKSGRETIKDIIPTEQKEYNVYYNARKGGYIRGELNQVVKEGEDATPVIAIAEHGYIFVSWSDGVRNPYRQDVNVDRTLELFVTFVTIDEYIEMLKDPGEPEVPEEPENAAWQMPKPDDESDEDGPKKYDSNSMIIDGETYYGESVYDEYLSEVIDALSQDSEMSSDTKKIINDYFDTIEK